MHFATFLKIFANPNSKTTPIKAVGNQWGTLIQGFVTKWQAGKVSDLAGALKKLDKDIDAQLAQANGGRRAVVSAATVPGAGDTPAPPPASRRRKRKADRRSPDGPRS